MAMHNPVAFEIIYHAHVRQTEEINKQAWQFVGTPRRHDLRASVARVLLALAHTLAPPATQEAQTV